MKKNKFPELKMYHLALHVSEKNQRDVDKTFALQVSV